MRFVWWIFHPAGYAISGSWLMNPFWFSIFLIWLTKGFILRLGGAATYRRMQPFFLGMALGQIGVGGVWLVIDGFTGTVGNRIPLYY